MDTFPLVPTQNYADIRNNIRSGDILLCSGNALFSTLIQKATQSVWSHVAFVLRVDAIDRIMLLESVESIGVRAVTLSSYLHDYNGTGLPYPGKLLLARHQDMRQENIKNLSKFAVDLLGHPYHTDEIANIAAKVSMNALGFPNGNQEALPQKEFICSEYAYACFKSVGVEVDYDKMGFIAPADFARCSKVTPLAFIQTATQQNRVNTKTTTVPFALA